MRRTLMVGIKNHLRLIVNNHRKFGMTVTIAATSRETIPDRRYIATPANRKVLAVHLISGDAVWGWNSDVDATTESATGIPLTIGATIFFGSENCAFSGPLYIYSTAGCVLRYQELNIP